MSAEGSNSSALVGLSSCSQQHLDNKRPTISDLIPWGDILFQIFLLLPVRTLCRFSCVSKSWHALISDPDFRRAYQQRPKRNPRLLVSTNHHKNHIADRDFYSFDMHGNFLDDKNRGSARLRHIL